ncbi:NADPH:quinone oxidoreductase family protein [Sneathiella sp.]|uniref:NADPH:quinone oxidoreductase family protein n=1 Tax=Sneathiella sp. TaxID=1964365 RepID=UPI0035663D8D
MRAIVVREFGPYREKAKLETLPIPEPGPGEVVVRNKASGVSFGMSLTIAGKYQRKPPLPFVPATEAAGIVHSIGAGVTRVSRGDHVMCNIDSGGSAGFNLTRDICCHIISKDMDFSVAAMIVLSYATSYGALHRRAQLKKGETVLVHGAAGAVGTAAVEIAKAAGAKVIAVAGGKHHCETALRHGADHVIDHREENFRDRVMELTDKRGVDIVYDSIGGEVTHQSIRAMAWEGRLLTIGYACGTIPEIPANLLLLKNISVMGFNLGHFFGWSPGGTRDQYVEIVDEILGGVLDLHSNGKINPEIGASYPLSQFNDALDAVIQRKVDGKCVITMSDADYGE